MKRKNYMLKFGLSITLVIILPILIVVNGIILLVKFINEGMLESSLYTAIVIVLISTAISFVLTMLVGYFSYKIDYKYDFSESDNTITNGRYDIRKDDIVLVRANRFIFLQSLRFYVKPWQRFAMMTYYFNNKEELISFIKANSFLLDYIKKEDLSKLGLDE